MSLSSQAGVSCKVFVVLQCKIMLHTASSVLVTATDM